MCRAWGNRTISRGDRLAHAIERPGYEGLPFTNIVTHLEPGEDPLLLVDGNLDREKEE